MSERPEVVIPDRTPGLYYAYESVGGFVSICTLGYDINPVRQLGRRDRAFLKALLLLAVVQVDEAEDDL